MDRDDSRPLNDAETTEMALYDVIANYDKRNIGIVHGDRYTWVHGYNVTNPQPVIGGGTDGRLVYLTDCYGDEIPGTYGRRSATVQAVVADHQPDA